MSCRHTSWCKQMPLFGPPCICACDRLGLIMIAKVALRHTWSQLIKLRKKSIGYFSTAQLCRYVLRVIRCKIFCEYEWNFKTSRVVYVVLKIRIYLRIISTSDFNGYYYSLSRDLKCKYHWWNSDCASSTSSTSSWTSRRTASISALSSSMRSAVNRRCSRSSRNCPVLQSLLKDARCLAVGQMTTTDRQLELDVVERCDPLCGKSTMSVSRTRTRLSVSKYLTTQTSNLSNDVVDLLTSCDF